ncbi:DUF3575 domain-containing protein [Ichthyenterobacterium sp. W332]|uniref:DUF3575 domain-containing protein n=1 Tax=Microcosmobacter mediterraneus TaxID=3075607 RepID=A0ABU2YL28_9FLAO|nr:DUF3575 domain-containing protein [Ichthyenterobacterium sp. W332]MDT0557950.1 DUF3575 domain-containing protein [Ichthyenterobacterium sp. W332]
MKKYTLFVISCLFIFQSFSQDKLEDDLTKRNFNEVKLNALLLVAGSFEVGYERTINEESSFGLSVLVPFDSEIKANIEYYISPYYRFYFGKKYAAGFFLEGFGMLNSTNRNNDLPLFTTPQSEFVTDFALGIGVGGKWLTRKGWTGELNLGIGRNLFNSDKGDEIVAKIGITLGYRF